jgi:ATP-dependent helicase HrpB
LRNELNEQLYAQQLALVVALREVFARHRDAVLHAPTGAGKSTLVPLALLHEAWVANRKILMLEPRRLAARAVAARMATLLGEPIGQTVGYRMRLDTRVSRATRIEVVTEGVLTRLLQEDPALEQVGCLIFDEYHERSLVADLGLALALDARRQLDAGFRILIMSATLECERVATLLGDADVATVPGRTFPVQVRYVGQGAPLIPDFGRPLERVVAPAVRHALRESSGDVLVFLPGAAEIRRTETLLRDGAISSDMLLLPLYGEMSASSQDAVLAAAPFGRRKVVLATNIAETSLTIPGVTTVVDCGLVRRSRFDPTTGMSRLELTRISRAASEQRAGRAGRVAPGVCIRLWSESAHTRLAPTTLPEILEADLAPLALELARWGVSSADKLQWLDAPPAPNLAQSRELLLRLHALDAQSKLTELGREMARLAVHPRLAHMLLASRELQAVTLAAQLAALLSERDLLPRGPPGLPRDPDIRTRLELMRGERPSDEGDPYVLRRAQREAQSLLAAMKNPALQQKVSEDRSGVDPALPGALLAFAYPDRIGQRRGDGEGRYLLANGRGASFRSATSLAREEFIVPVLLDDREREAQIDLAAPLARASLERLFADEILGEEIFGWDAREAAVIGRRIRRLGALLIENTLLPIPNDSRTVDAMLQGVAQMGLEALPWDEESRALQARQEFVRTLNRGDLAPWPASDDAALTASLPQWLAPYLEGITRRQHLARVSLTRALRERLNPAQARALESLAPRELVMPTGSHIRVDYLDDSAPCVSVRLQEVFGMQQTPHIGAGTKAITFKLLSPAHRPVQVTRDLAGFWRGSYAEVRKDMRGRYPKHYWPENPLEAMPTRGTGRGSRQRPTR